MSTEAANKAIVGRWFTAFWGKTYDRTRKVKILERALASAVMSKQALPPIQLSS